MTDPAPEGIIMWHAAIEAAAARQEGVRLGMPAPEMGVELPPFEQVKGEG